MTLLQKIGIGTFGLAGLAYSACATPYVKPEVVVEAEQPQPQIAWTEKVYDAWAKLTIDTFLGGEKVQGNFHDIVVYGEVRDPQDCIKVKEYKTSQGNFAVVVPQFPEHLKDLALFKLYNEQTALGVQVELLEGVAWLSWKFECHNLLPQGKGYALVLDDSTVLVPQPDNYLNATFERHFSWESATAREHQRTDGPMDHPQYPITPKLEAMLAEAADGIEKIGESQ